MGDAGAAARAARGDGAAAAGMRVFSPEYYAICAGGGMLAAGATHLAITPLDVLKVNMQVSRLLGVGCSRCSCGAAVWRAAAAAPLFCCGGRMLVRGVCAAVVTSNAMRIWGFQSVNSSSELDMLGVRTRTYC